MSPLLAMLFLSLVICSSYASQHIVLTLVEGDKVVNKYATSVSDKYHASTWLSDGSEVFKLEDKKKATGKLKLTDTVIHIVARTIEDPMNKITLDDNQATEQLGCDGECLAKIIEKIVKAKMIKVTNIIFWTSSIDVSNYYSRAQEKTYSLIVVFLSALKNRGITTTVIATVGDPKSPHTIFANNNNNIEFKKNNSPYTQFHKELLEYTTGEYRHTKYFYLFPLLIK